MGERMEPGQTSDFDRDLRRPSARGIGADGDHNRLGFVGLMLKGNSP